MKEKWHCKSCKPKKQFFDKLKKDFPDRVINPGASEQLMMGMASGMAMDGFKPIVYSITPFILFRPFDFIRNFLNSWKPNAIFLVDSEIWPNLIFEARFQNIPIALLNARITNKTFRKWKIFPKTAKKIFENYWLR